MNVQGSVECSTNTLHASWDAAPGAASYVTTVYRAGGFSSSCYTYDQSCDFPDLECAQMYMFSVVAQNDRCNSSESAMVSAKTGKCAYKSEPFILGKWCESYYCVMSFEDEFLQTFRHNVQTFFNDVPSLRYCFQSSTS